MSYIKLLNLLQAVKNLPTFPALDAVEERLLNTLATVWHDGNLLTVLNAMEILEDASAATVHRRLKTLKTKGFISLETDQNDNRVKYIVATPLTKKYFARIEDCLEKARE